MLRYYNLFDLLFRKKMKLTDLRKILSPATVAKLRKGEYISGEAIDKICDFLECQPGDIMEHYKIINASDNTQTLKAIKTIKEINEYGEEIPKDVIVKGINEPLDKTGKPVKGWYEKELIKDYNEMDNLDKVNLDYENALINKKIKEKLLQQSDKENVDIPLNEEDTTT